MDDVDCQLAASSLEPSGASCSSSDASVDAMFKRVIEHKDAYFRSEQVGAPDLTDDEKKSLLGALFASKPVVFLSRYWQFLDHSDRACFAQLEDDYDIAFYLGQIAADPRGSGRGRGRSKLTANRRYAALRQLVTAGDYFSDEQMRQREPLLYDQMVGQYLTDLEKGRLMPKTDRSGTLTGMFADFADTQRTAIRRREEEAYEDHSSRREKLLRHARNRMGAIYPDSGNQEGIRASGSSDEEEEEELSDDDEEDDPAEAPFPPSATPEEQSQLRAEFISHMHERFLAGKDAEFVDYHDIDSNARNDPIDLIQRDAEDDYFDSEEPNNVKEE